MRNMMIAALAAMGSALVSPLPAMAQSQFPERPVRLIVPYAPGGSTDIVARVVAENTDLGGYRIVVENMPGAGGQIAFEAVRNAPADGYTIAMATTGITSAPFLMKSFTLDPVNDFTPVSVLAKSSGLLVSVHASVPATDLAELIAYSKANPDALNIGTTAGSLDLDIPLFEKATGMTLTRIPFKGQAPVLQAIAAGELQVIMDPPWSSRPLLENKTIRPIAVGTPERIGLLPDVPTIAESGFPGLGLTVTWFGIMGPKGVPEDVVTKLSDSLAAAVASEAVQTQLGKLGMTPAHAGPAQMADIIADDMRRFAEGAAIGGIVPQ